MVVKGCLIKNEGPMFRSEVPKHSKGSVSGLGSLVLESLARLFWCRSMVVKYSGVAKTCSSSNPLKIPTYPKAFWRVLYCEIFLNPNQFICPIKPQFIEAFRANN